MSVRLGVGYGLLLTPDVITTSYPWYPFPGVSAALSIPLVFNYIGLRKDSHILEIGLGPDLVLLNNIKLEKVNLAGIAVLGYRYQGSSFNFRVGGSIVAGSFGVTPLPHLSFGFSF